MNWFRDEDRREHSRMSVSDADAMAAARADRLMSEGADREGHAEARRDNVRSESQPGEVRRNKAWRDDERRDGRHENVVRRSAEERAIHDHIVEDAMIATESRADRVDR